jgi:hypothetical protein
MVTINQKQFFQYIERVVNPERKKLGLSRIDKGDAIKAYWILSRFFAEWAS